MSASWSPESNPSPCVPMNIDMDRQDFEFQLDPLNLNGILHLDERKRKDPSQITRVCQIVKEQLAMFPYAKISAPQQIAADTNSDNLISRFTNDVIPKDLTSLMGAFYPSFHWNEEYISLQSSHKNANIYVIPKACCELSGYLSAYISNQYAPSSIVKIQNMNDNILELFVKYIVNKHERDLYRCKNEMEKQYFDIMSFEYDSQFVDELNEETIQQLCDAAMKMGCESLFSLTENTLSVMEAR